MTITLPKLTLYAQNGCNDFVFNIPFSVFQAPYQGKKLFDFQIVSDNGKAIRTELGATITPHGNLDLMDNADIIVISGWVGDKPSRAFTQKLQTAHQNGKKIIALCYGAFGLAFADILTDKTVVTHWAGENAFKHKFPHIKLDNNKLYLDDGNILTSAGAYAGMDCCLYFIRTLYGASVANDLARLFVSAPHREGGQAQFSQLSIVNHTKDSKINDLLRFLSDNLDKTHTLDDLADKVHLSKRSFNRYFKNATNMTLTQWLTAKRLAKVQDYLESTDLPIEIIADKTGFGTASNLRMQFKARFGVSPQSFRNSFGND
ncbi:GlxA family transcriptional regulator [Moraxella sp. ZY210820]|uniref:GlxA family transcriptional regulator n=1 Tax=unclassified Moraxella TaxID=2685852 RepID=UPI0027322B62|nr:helix-turn-helix domain-containing protein [Moraxella sp. ZY210820]WLF83373.1 helix-turn-helix domain-containing protein [Moraxella sp. ZY210820]